MTNEFPNRYGSRGDEAFGDDRGEEKSEMEESNDNFFPSADERRVGRRNDRESDESNVRHRPRNRYPRRRLTSGSRNKGQGGHEESRDLPLRQRMKIYRNRRPSR